MNTVLKLYLSASVSGSLVILALFLGKQFWKNRLGRQWQYYLWLVVVLRLLLPFTPEVSLMGETYRAVDRSVAEAVSAQPQNLSGIQPCSLLWDGRMEGEAAGESAYRRAQIGPKEEAGAESMYREAENHPADGKETSVQDVLQRLAEYAWLLWLVVAAAVLIRRATAYRSYIRYVRAGAAPVSDVAALDLMAVSAQRAGVKRAVELCVSPVVSSPLLIGMFRPCIVLTDRPLSEKEFCYTALHELIHFKRRDMLYRWLVQITVCLHWFNPLVWLMSREITRACEFSCDEAVLAKTGDGCAQDYGKTLLDAMAAVGKCKSAIGSVTLSGNKQLLKERLGAIMNNKKKTGAARFLAAVLTVCVTLGAAFVGVYPASADSVSAGLLKAKTNTKKAVKVEFGGIVIEGEGPVGLDLVRTEKSKVSIEYLNMENPESCVAKKKLNGHILQITVKNTAKSVTNVSFGDKPRNVVRIYIPDAVYDSFEISLNQAVLCMQDFRAEVHVKAKEGGVSLIDTDISRGTYDIDITSGPLEIEADTILKDITADVDSGPISLCFHKKPKNLYLDTTGCGPGKSEIERPKGWPAVYQTGNGTPRIVLNNWGPLTVEVKAREEARNLNWNKILWDWADDDWDWADDDWDWDEDDWDWADDWDEDDWDWADDDWDWDWSEYAPFGVACADGKKLYYRGERVKTFLDELPAEKGRFYRLNIDPKGKVNIKIVRDQDNKITGVEYMTQAEVERLTGQ